MGCTSSKEAAGGIDESLITSATTKKKSYMKRRSTSLTEGSVGVEIDGYEMLGFLGKGAYAHVERAREVATGEEVAIKVFERGVLRKQKSMTRVGRQVTVTTALDKLDAEISLMRSLDHSHIIRLYDVVEDPVPGPRRAPARADAIRRSRTASSSCWNWRPSGPWRPSTRSSASSAAPWTRAPWRRTAPRATWRRWPRRCPTCTRATSCTAT